MADATINSALQIRKVDSTTGLTVLDYQSRPSSFQGTVTGTKGPTPGAITVTTTGVDVDLSELTDPGYCRLMNLSPSNYVEWGVHDGSLFHPVGEILPTETYVIRLSRSFGEEHTIAGTGTTGVVNTLHLRANTAACVVLVEAFER